MNQTVFTFPIEVEIAEGVTQEIELNVTGTYTPGERGTRGDFGVPLEPDYGPEFTVDSIFDQFGNEYHKEDLGEYWAQIEDAGIEAATEDKNEDVDEWGAYYDETILKNSLGWAFNQPLTRCGWSPLGNIKIP